MHINVQTLFSGCAHEQSMVSPWWKVRLLYVLKPLPFRSFAFPESVDFFFISYVACLSYIPDTQFPCLQLLSRPPWSFTRAGNIKSTVFLARVFITYGTNTKLVLGRHWIMSWQLNTQKSSKQIQPHSSKKKSSSIVKVMVKFKETVFDKTNDGRVILVN
jgi:hypothetical protein